MSFDLLLDQAIYCQFFFSYLGTSLVAFPLLPHFELLDFITFSTLSWLFW